jgi:hypothetical protein
VSDTSLHKHVLSFLLDHVTDEMSLARVQAIKFLTRLGLDYSPTVYRYMLEGDEGEREQTVLTALADRLYTAATQAPAGESVDPNTTRASLWAIGVISKEIGVRCYYSLLRVRFRVGVRVRVRLSLSSLLVNIVITSVLSLEKYFLFTLTLSSILTLSFYPNPNPNL